MRQSIKIFLERSVTPATLTWFRIGFGLVLAFQVIHFLNVNFVEEDIVKPLIRYKFQGFEWVQPMGGGAMTALLFLLLGAAFLVVAGKWMKPALGFYLLGFTYIWLLDKGYFNNHYYLLSIMCGLMLFTDADRWSPWGGKRAYEVEPVPFWQVFALQLQLFIVFFWAGINKLNAGWLLHHEPLSYILKTKAVVTGEAGWDSPALAAFLTYGGLLFDLLVIPALWWRPTRRYAFIGMLVFNGFNLYLFHDVGEIGIFPFFVAVSTVLFFPPDLWAGGWGRKQAVRGKSKTLDRKHPVQVQTARKWAIPVLAAWLTLQALLPARHLLIPGHVDWTGEGQRFSWRMKIFVKEFSMQFFVVPGDGSGERFTVDVGRMLTPKQYTALGHYPDLIQPTAAFLREEALRKGIPDPVVQVDFRAAMNGYAAQPLLEPTLDACKLDMPFFGHADWILPYAFRE